MLTLADVLAARTSMARHVWRTPLLRSGGLEQGTGGQVFLKLECWQRTGSFKVRGALHRLAVMSERDRQRGVVTASAGNHGLGVALASRVLGLAPATVFVPETAAPGKLQRLMASGCQVRQAGADYDAAHALAEAYAAEGGALYVSAYDDPLVMAGQGTVGLEVLEDLPAADVLLVPVGGGGLIAGIAVAAKAIKPGIRVVGVQPAASPAAYLSLRDGRAYETYPAEATICDGLAGGFGGLPFEIAKDLVDEILVVPETAVRDAVRWLLVEEQLVVEGSGAIAIAPLLLGYVDIKDKRVVPVLTGRNLDASLLREILNERLQAGPPGTYA
jgi:threonine dehydratase